MIGIVMIVASVIAMAKIASMEGRSPVIWGALTLVICFASGIIPIPLVNILIGFILSFMILFIVKMMQGGVGQ